MLRLKLIHVSKRGPWYPPTADAKLTPVSSQSFGHWPWNHARAEIHFMVTFAKNLQKSICKINLSHAFVSYFFYSKLWILSTFVAQNGTRCIANATNMWFTCKMYSKSITLTQEMHLKILITKISNMWLRTQCVSKCSNLHATRQTLSYWVSDSTATSKDKSSKVI